MIKNFLFLIALLILTSVSAISLGAADGTVNLGRLSITSVYGFANGGRPTDDRFYGVLNLFDEGKNVINNINYNSWHTGGPKGGDNNWVLIRFAVPVELRRVMVRLKQNYHKLPDAYELYVRSEKAILFKNKGIIKLSDKDNMYKVPEPIQNVRELLFNFLPDDQYLEVEELELYGMVPPGTDLKSVKPSVAEDSRESLSEFPIAQKSPSEVVAHKIDNAMHVFKGEELLFQVPIKETEIVERYGWKIKKEDITLLAGRCFLVWRDHMPGEVYPSVSQLETYQLSGKKTVYSNKDLDIGAVSRFQTSPSGEWSVDPQYPEGHVYGFFYLSPECQIREIKFPDGIYKDGVPGDYFKDESTFVLPDLEQKIPKGTRRKINILIHKNGEYTINALRHK